MISKQPYCSSIAIIILLPLTVFSMNIILIFFVGMKVVNETILDLLLHTLGGISISISIAGVLWHLAHRRIIVVHDVAIYRVLVFGLVCFVVICWELLEFILYTHPDILTYPDTITDMCCGLVGGLLGMFSIPRSVCEMPV